MSPEDLPYRQNIGLVIFNEKGDVFAGERIDTPGAWQMPQGGIDEGEDIETAAYRELYEETGIEKHHLELLEIATEKTSYDLPPELQKRLWRGRFRGQEQVWLAFKFTGSDTDIDILAHEPPEFSRWKWLPFPDLLDYIVPFKKDTYIKVMALFKGHIK